MRRASWSAIVFALVYVVVVVGVFLALGGAAYAQAEPSPASDQYGPKVVNVFTPPTTEPTGVASDVAAALPNTGLSLLATALVGGALLVLGIALRRRERRNDAEG